MLISTLAFVFAIGNRIIEHAAKFVDFEVNFWKIHSEEHRVKKKIVRKKKTNLKTRLGNIISVFVLYNIIFFPPEFLSHLFSILYFPIEWKLDFF